MPCRGIAVFIAGFLLAVAACGAAAAATADSKSAEADVTVVGNQHIGADMIRSHFHPAPDGHLDPAAIDAALKELYATGLFTDVKISHAGNRVLVVVVENPMIGVVAFEGNKKLKDADLSKFVQSKAGGPLSREMIQSAGRAKNDRHQEGRQERPH
jgi:outer membrane protein insertion porin family